MVLCPDLEAAIDLVNEVAAPKSPAEVSELIQGMFPDLAEEYSKWRLQVTSFDILLDWRRKKIEHELSYSFARGK